MSQTPSIRGSAASADPYVQVGPDALRPQDMKTRGKGDPRSSGASIRGPRRKVGGRLVDEGLGILVASALSSLCILLADRIWRPDWDFHWADHWRGAPVLYLSAATLLGLGWINLRLLQQGVSVRFLESPRERDAVRGSFIGALCGLFISPLAMKTFSGTRVSETWLGQWGPTLIILVAVAGGFVLTVFMWRTQRRVARHQFKGAVGASLLLFFAGCSALWVDMSLYVGLYSHLHEFLEFSAFCLFFATFQLTGFVLVRRWRGALLVSRIIGSGLVIVLLVFIGIEPLRTWTDARLAHAWVDEYYVGRTLRRAQQLQLSVSEGGSFQMARVEQLVRRFDVRERSLKEEWLRKVEVPGHYPGVKNIIFFYVDTLRADVAAAPTIAPHLAAFRAQSLDYSHAYATGSDTLRSLPTITSGNYFANHTHPGDLLRLAKQNDVRSVLVVAQSASEFLEDQLPRFAFDELRTVADYKQGKSVWGYGAHLSTAQAVGDEADTFLKSEQANDPFLLWLFHFDVHAWRELDSEYIRTAQRAFDIPNDGPWNLRYRVVARAIDEQFGRLLATLERTGRSEDTAVVFVSDHGEGLGQGGFWVHSIFLWESLVRVPLVIRIPGVEPARVSAPVSLVDIAPTLAPLLGGGPAIYHGESLVPSRLEFSERRLPILLRAGQFSGLDRAGIIDARVGRKLVVRLEAAFPELYDYESDPLDGDNLARDEPEHVRSLLQEMARSPVFPRNAKDFEMQTEVRELSLSSDKPLGAR